VYENEEFQMHKKPQNSRCIKTQNFRCWKKQKISDVGKNEEFQIHEKRRISSV
jgi:hypothetical protein